MIVAVDFDGVIFDKSNGQLVDGAKEALTKLSKNNEVLIFTSRPDYFRGYIKGILEANGIPYDRIQCGKPQYDRFIDDKAEKFTSWKEVS